MTGAPYRAPHEGAVRRLRIFPLVTYRIVVAMLFFGALPLGLFLFLWSRVVQVDCAIPTAGTVVCDVREDTVLIESKRTVALQAPLRAAFVGETDRSRGDAWIEVVAPQGSVQLTSGFNGSKEDQRQVARSLSHWFRSGPGASYHGGFGTRWGMLPIPVFTMAFAFALWLVWGQSVTFVKEGSPAALAIETRRWPLPARRYSFELRQIAHFELGPDPQSRIAPARTGLNLIARTVAGERIVLAMVDSRRAQKVLARIAAFLRET